MYHLWDVKMLYYLKGKLNKATKTYRLSIHVQTMYMRLDFSYFLSFLFELYKNRMPLMQLQRPQVFIFPAPFNILYIISKQYTYIIYMALHQCVIEDHKTKCVCLIGEWPITYNIVSLRSRRFSDDLNGAKKINLDFLYHKFGEIMSLQPAMTSWIRSRLNISSDSQSYWMLWSYPKYYCDGFLSLSEFVFRLHQIQQWTGSVTF